VTLRRQFPLLLILGGIASQSIPPLGVQVIYHNERAHVAYRRLWGALLALTWAASIAAPLLQSPMTWARSEPRYPRTG